MTGGWVASATTKSADQGKERRQKIPPSPEQRLRYWVIFFFGLLYLLSYGLAIVFAFDFYSPYYQGLAGPEAIAGLCITIGSLVVIGGLMFATAFSRRAFHALAAFVVLLRAAMIVFAFLHVYAFEEFTSLVSGNILVLFAGSTYFNAEVSAIFEFVLWCLPFLVYYVSLLVKMRRESRIRQAIAQTEPSKASESTQGTGD